jgi:hypothetical protein
MPQVIEILDNVIIGIHKCDTNGKAIELFKIIIKETIQGAGPMKTLPPLSMKALSSSMAVMAQSASIWSNP